MLAIRTSAAVIALLACATAVVLSCGKDERAPQLRTASASGAVRLSNSREGEAIIGAGNMVPGDSTQGTVTIANSGDAPGETRLEPTDLVDAVSPTGAPLSGRLVLEVTDSNGATVYRGTLAEMSTAFDLGTFAPGQERTYRFVATLPRSTDNAYQASKVVAGFRWTMTGDDASPQPAATAPSVAPKRLSVWVRRTKIGRTLRRNRIRLAVVCSRPCRATLSATARWGRGRHRVRRVKRATRSLPGRATTVRLVVPRKVRRKKTFLARVTVSAVAADGTRAAVTRTFRLRKKGRRR